MRVLVVDDDAACRQLISDLLQSDGYEVLTAAEAREALQLASHYRCDLVITDFAMPGMNGDELITLLRQNQYPARYLVISGSWQAPPDSDLSLLPKPFTATQLKGAIEKLLKKPADRENPNSLLQRWRIPHN